MTDAPRPEVVAAADWWADTLARGASHDNGDAMTSTMLAAAGDLMTPRSDEQVAAFRAALPTVIERHLAGCTWDTDRPEFGSAFRTIAIDYAPDRVLSDAAAEAGFSLRMTDLPVKTVMWINPGQVTVSEGHGAEPHAIWQSGEDQQAG